MGFNIVKIWPAYISPLPAEYRYGMVAIVVCAVLSTIATASLAIYLGYRIVYRRRRRLAQSQLSILLFNLMIADLKQTIGYLLTAHWLQIDAMDGNDSVCWAQGWLLTIGNLGSALFAFTIALYTFVYITFKFQLRTIWFYFFVVFLWTCVYGVAIWGAGVNARGYFRPEALVCLISYESSLFAVWLHYFWIAMAEIASIVLYTILFFILRRRIKDGTYAADRGKKALLISRLIFLYPGIYTICTAPLLAVPALTQNGKTPTIAHLSISYALWTSIGWLDVVAYAMTRRFEPAKEMSQLSQSESLDPLDTFNPWWFPRGPKYGTTTVCEAVPVASDQPQRLKHHKSTDELLDPDNPAGLRVQTHTTVNVISSPLELDDLEAYRSNEHITTKGDQHDTISLEEWAAKSSNIYLHHD